MVSALTNLRGLMQAEPCWKALVNLEKTSVHFSTAMHGKEKEKHDSRKKEITFCPFYQSPVKYYSVKLEKECPFQPADENWAHFAHKKTLQYSSQYHQNKSC